MFFVIRRKKYSHFLIEPVQPFLIKYIQTYFYRKCKPFLIGDVKPFLVAWPKIVSLIYIILISFIAGNAICKSVRCVASFHFVTTGFNPLKIAVDKNENRRFETFTYLKIFSHSVINNYIKFKSNISLCTNCELLTVLHHSTIFIFTHSINVYDQNRHFRRWPPGKISFE